MNKKTIYSVWIGLLITSFFLDNIITNFIPKIRCGFLDYIFGWGSHIQPFLISFLIVAVLAGSLMYLEKKKWLWLYFFNTLVLAFLITFGIKFLAGRERPVISMISGLTNSFPSGHAALFFTPLNFLVKYKAVWLAIALFIIIGRIYLGMHYLSDSVAGALIGYAAGDFFFLIYHKNS